MVLPSGSAISLLLLGGTTQTLPSSGLCGTWLISQELASPFLWCSGHDTLPVLFGGFSHSGEATSKRRRTRTDWLTCVHTEMK